MSTRLELEQRVDAFLTCEIDRILSSVPYAEHLISDRQYLDEEYYLRHRIETIKRIQFTARIDALALARMIEEDYESSRFWSQYTAEELNHDILYRRDLYQHGYSDTIIDETPPFIATEELIKYLTRRIDEIGALAAVGYSLFVEWNSERVSARVVARAENRFSAEHVSGSRCHVNIDKNSYHYSMILGIAHQLVRRMEDDHELFITLKDISYLFSSYFNELYEATVEKRVVGEIPKYPSFSEQL